MGDMGDMDMGMGIHGRYRIRFDWRKEVERLMMLWTKLETKNIDFKFAQMYDQNFRVDQTFKIDLM